MDFVSKHLPQPFRDRIIAASMMDEEAERIRLYREISQEAREAHPELFLNDIEAEVLSLANEKARMAREARMLELRMQEVAE